MIAKFSKGKNTSLISIAWPIFTNMNLRWSACNMGKIIVGLVGIIFIAGGAGNSDLNPTDSSAGLIPCAIGLALLGLVAYKSWKEAA